MKKLLDSIVESLKKNQPVVLVSVIASSGSTPRGAGAMMAVFPLNKADSATTGMSAGEPATLSTGTIGGGAVEYEAIRQATLMFDTKHSRISSYSLDRSDVADLGMICGGDVTVFYEYLDPADVRTLELYEYIRAAFSKDENVWLVRMFKNNAPVETAVFDSGGLRFADLIKETDIKPLLGNSPELSGGNPQYYTEPIVRAGRVYVFGGGHVSQELVPLLSHVGFSVVVYEDRENFAKEELFPDASEIVLNDFLRISDKVTVGAPDYVVVMTRGHQNDYDVLEQMLRTPARYVGCIGSASKLDATKRRLIEAGVSEAAFDKLYSPIGLKIKAETPAEIAVSVAAEMILFRASVS